MALAWADTEGRMNPDIPADAREAMRSSFYSGAIWAIMLLSDGAKAETLMQEMQHAARTAVAARCAP